MYGSQLSQAKKDLTTPCSQFWLELGKVTSPPRDSFTFSVKEGGVDGRNNYPPVTEPNLSLLACVQYSQSTGTSLVAQWLRIHLPMQGIRV